MGNAPNVFAQGKVGCERGVGCGLPQDMIKRTPAKGCGWSMAQSTGKLCWPYLRIHDELVNFEDTPVIPQ